MISNDTFNVTSSTTSKTSSSSTSKTSSSSSTLEYSKIIQFPQLYENSKNQKHFYFDSASIPQISKLTLTRNSNLLLNHLFINSHSNGGVQTVDEEEVEACHHHQSSSTIEHIQNVRNMIMAHFNAIPTTGLLMNDNDMIKSSICSSDASYRRNDSSDEFEVVFTSGATGALNLIASSIMIPAVTLATQVVQICTQLFTSFLYTTSSSSNTSSAQVWFLDVNHTSVIGMTPLLQTRFPHSTCRFLSFDEIEQFLSTTSATPAPFLFCFPAQCNFSGARYPVEKWTKAFQKRGSLVLVDAASYCSTATLDVRYILFYHVGINSLFNILCISFPFANLISPSFPFTKCLEVLLALAP